MISPVLTSPLGAARGTVANRNHHEEASEALAGKSVPPSNPYGLPAVISDFASRNIKRSIVRFGSQPGGYGDCAAPLSIPACGARCGTLSTSHTTAVKTIQMTIDQQLLKLVDKLSRDRKTSRSAFIRDALEAEIRRQRVLADEIRHAEGYARQPVAPGEFDAWLSEQDWGAS